MTEERIRELAEAVERRTCRCAECDLARELITAVLEANGHTPRPPAR